MSNPIVLTRDKVKRPWAELEPKIAVAMIVGFLALAAVIIAPKFGVELPVEVYAVIPVTFSLIAGYLTSSVGLVITNTSTGVSESHTGNVVATVTAATPVVNPATIARDYADAAQSFTQTVEGTASPDQPTEVMPTSSRVAEFVKGLPSTSPLSPKNDGTDY